ncbi:hypothetical protein Q1695_016112 [Nippostrongylus brasiliensis]|nr:hypothetical protein Q1695_016112 [Nippostrongylus brasiliensis]
MVAVHPSRDVTIIAASEPKKPLPDQKKDAFFSKYFLAGQQMADPSDREVPPDADFVERFLITKRKYIAFLIPLTVMQVLWWLTAYRYNWFPLFATRWQMPAIMVLGSTVAGMTSEGGGAVAFPFMTLCLHIDPVTARDFSLMIQTFGMGCALFVVLFMGIQIERHSLLFGCLGSIPGMVLGFAFVDDLFDAGQKKMMFVSIWCSFAIALFLLNSQKKRTTYAAIPDFKPWKAVVLVLTGFIGGIFTSFAGSGVDICVFSINTLLFRVSEKTATPTTVVMMGLNSMVGMYTRAVWYGDVSQLTYEYLKVTIPVATMMAPLGSFLGSHFHRQVLACFVYVLEALSVLGFLITQPPLVLVLIGAGIIIIAFAFFYVISRVGERIMTAIERVTFASPAATNEQRRAKKSKTDPRKRQGQHQQQVQKKPKHEEQFARRLQATEILVEAEHECKALAEKIVSKHEEFDKFLSDLTDTMDDGVSDPVATFYEALPAIERLLAGLSI